MIALPHCYQIIRFTLNNDMSYFYWEETLLVKTSRVSSLLLNFMTLYIA